MVGSVSVSVRVCMYDYHIAVSIKTLAPFERFICANARLHTSARQKEPGGSVKENKLNIPAVSAHRSMLVGLARCIRIRSRACAFEGYTRSAVCKVVYMSM